VGNCKFCGVVNWFGIVWLLIVNVRIAENGNRGNSYVA